MGKNYTVSLSLNDADIEMMDSLMTSRGTHNRSALMRNIIREAAGGIEERSADRPTVEGTDGTPAKNMGGTPTENMGGTPVAELVLAEIASLAGTRAPDGADLPAMSVAGYNLALVAARRHIDEILDGTLPLVPDDVSDAGQGDPHSREVWDLYHDVLPRFFQLFLGASMPAVDLRYGPLDEVDGQHAGAVRGSVVSKTSTYPANDTTKYVKLVVGAGTQDVPVVMPAGMCPAGVEPGVVVYTAGTFDASRQRVEMRAHKCTVERIEGFDVLYEMAGDWGCPAVAATRAALMLRRIHGRDAVRMTDVFRKYAEIDHESADMDMVLSMPNGTNVWLGRDDIRSGTRNEVGFMECVRLWPVVVRRTRRYAR